jgi:hypothetical protein
MFILRRQYSSEPCHRQRVSMPGMRRMRVASRLHVRALDNLSSILFAYPTTVGNSSRQTLSHRSDKYLRIQTMVNFLPTAYILLASLVLPFSISLLRAQGENAKESSVSDSGHSHLSVGPRKATPVSLWASQIPATSRHNRSILNFQCTPYARPLRCPPQKQDRQLRQ